MFFVEFYKFYLYALKTVPRASMPPWQVTSYILFYQFKHFLNTSKGRKLSIFQMHNCFSSTKFDFVCSNLIWTNASGFLKRENNISLCFRACSVWVSTGDTTTLSNMVSAGGVDHVKASELRVLDAPRCSVYMRCPVSSDESSANFQRQH